MPPTAVKQCAAMSQSNIEPPVNPLPPVVVALFLVIIVVEGAFTLGSRGLVGGPQAIGGVVIAVDPLAADYVDNLRRVGREFARALQP